MILNELCVEGEVIEEFFDELCGGWLVKCYIYNLNYFSVLSVYVEGINDSGVILFYFILVDGKKI